MRIEPDGPTGYFVSKTCDMKSIQLSIIAVLILSLTSCAVVRQGEVGVKRTLGTYKEQPYTEGLRLFNPFVSTIVKVSTQTENLEVALSIPSKEGLNIAAEVSILYHVIPRKAPDLLINIGKNYEKNIILPVFRSAVADVSSRFFARDMHTGERAQIEKAIREQMMSLLDGKGIEIEAVLMKSIQMPKNLARAIEEKLEADQSAQRMEFVLNQARQEAERRRIEAEGVRDAQAIISEGLNPMILQFKSIEAFLQLAQSPNAKIILSDGDLPMLMNMDGEGEVKPSSVEGMSRILRDGKVLWQKPFLSGEEHMSHTIANLEYHHFKYRLFRQPGDIHVHMFGTATLSFADGIRTQAGDVFEIEEPQFGAPLRNAVAFDNAETVEIKPL